MKRFCGRFFAALLGAALLAVGTGCPGGSKAVDTVAAPGIVTASGLPAATVGRFYSTTLAVSGLTPARWDLTVGSFPIGITLDNLTGTISGTPTAFVSAAAPASFTITLTDTGGVQISKAFTLSVAVGLPQVLDATPSIAADSGASVVARLGGVAFNNLSATPQFAVMWDDTTNAATTGNDVFRRSLGTDALPLAATAPVITPAETGTQARPGLAFDNVNARYLVAWAHDEPAGVRAVRGALLDATFAVLPAGVAPCSASVICVSTTGLPVTTEQVAVAYSATSQLYLVAWQDGAAPNVIKGRRVAASGALVDAADIAISTDGAVENRQPAVAWDGANNQFLAVWSQYNGAAAAATLSSIRGRFVSATAPTATAAAAAFDVSPTVATAPAVRLTPAVAFNAASRRFVIVWSQQAALGSTTASIIGQIAQTNGALEASFSPQGPAGATSKETTPAVLAGSDGIGLLVWVSDRSSTGSGLDLFAAMLDATGAVGAEMALVTGVDQGTLLDQAEPRLGYDTINKRWLCVYGSFNSFAAPTTAKIKAVRVTP